MESETNQYPMSFRCGEYYVYFTSKCLIEAFHVHAGKDKKQKIYQSWIEHNGTPGYYVGKKK